MMLSEELEFVTEFEFFQIGMISLRRLENRDMHAPGRTGVHHVFGCFVEQVDHPGIRLPDDPQSMNLVLRVESFRDTCEPRSCSPTDPRFRCKRARLGRGLNYSH